MANKNYDHRVDLDDEDDDGEVEINLENLSGADDPEIEIEAEAPPSKKAAAADPEPEPEEAPEPEQDEPARVDPEVAELRARLDSLTQFIDTNRRAAQDHAAQAELNEIDAGIASAKARLREASVSGDADGIVAATDDLTELKAERKAREVAARQPAQQPVQQQPQQPQSPQLAEDWKQKNSNWFGKKGYEAETLLTHAIDAQMAREGWSPQSRGYYAEMNKRIAAKTRINPTGLDAGASNGRASPQVAPAGRSAAPVKKGVVRLDKTDFAVMRMAGLDPNKKEDQREYARSKQSYGN